MSDPLQFEAFMRDYQNMVFSTAYRLLADKAEAEDISQEVFLKAYTHFDDLQSSTTVGGWLKTVTRNLCLTFLTRRRSRWKLFSEFDSDDEDAAGRFEEKLGGAETTSEALDATDRRETLSAELDKLPAPQRVALVLYHFHELSYEEIADQLKVSLSKVKVDIHRARQTLRRRMEGSRQTLLS
jgi:RNA polymerase sigma-70 factor (ECF subfamily)